MNGVAETERGWPPLLKAALVLIALAAFILVQVLDIRGFGFVVLAVCGLTQIWRKQSVGIFSREHDPVIFWPTVLILIFLSFLWVLEFAQSLAAAFGFSIGAGVL